MTSKWSLRFFFFSQKKTCFCKKRKTRLFLLNIRSTKSGLRLMWLCLINADLSEFFKSVKYLMIGLIVFELFDLKVDVAVPPQARPIFKNWCDVLTPLPPYGEERGDFFFVLKPGSSSFIWCLIWLSVMDINGAITKKPRKIAAPPQVTIYITYFCKNIYLYIIRITLVSTNINQKM